MLPARDNPFAVHRVLRLRTRLDEAGWAVLLARLAAHRWRGAIVGPHGSGKTTLLEDLGARFAADGWRVHWIRLSADVRAVPAGFFSTVARTLGPGDALLVDGAEQLGAAAWWALGLRVRRVGAMIATTHREGRLPSVHRCTTSPELLSELVAALGETIAPSEAIALHTRHRGNIREALRELYDVASVRGPGLTSSGPAA
ncbi:MAG: hypothetical protein IAE82_16080 [Opitutaceae bacterium]|nr:hypothetical protein [Opitutaceae bacterium]